MKSAICKDADQKLEAYIEGLDQEVSLFYRLTVSKV